MSAALAYSMLAALGYSPIKGDGTWLCSVGVRPIGLGTAGDPGRGFWWDDAHVDKVCMESGPGTSAQSN